MLEQRTQKCREIDRTAHWRVGKARIHKALDEFDWAIPPAMRVTLATEIEKSHGKRGNVTVGARPVVSTQVTWLGEDRGLRSQHTGGAQILYCSTIMFMLSDKNGMF
ncbi:hypothetical protein [Sinorhizobium meliloti]|uniref:hypothetical protein n=1 Tax=Rhizobium meliloti TaxID=382 RepID=UPI000FD8010E|nr:hypothetical protein [Sinorhizobium meliloti]RVM14266.1 hypothetical protein CN134_17535 [Sinorhizobium meliloti]RVO29841.1 hypothetical protein CN098_17145 [Sinorhizobium meliloti]RVO48846.1 hypothetical protein CN092_30330 [Sinorhizobium meliloti]